MIEGPLRPRLVAITDLSLVDRASLRARLSTLAQLAQPGSLAILLRDHEASAQLRLDLGRELRSLTRATGHELWVADRIDLALVLDAEGLHLGEGSVPPSRARTLWPSRHLSRAWHETTPPSARELQGVDALVLSPLFAERKGRPALGPEALSELRRALGEPAPALYGLGGVSSATAAACLAAGAAGVAAIGAALSPTPSALLAALGALRSATG